MMVVEGWAWLLYHHEGEPALGGVSSSCHDGTVDLRPPCSLRLRPRSVSELYLQNWLRLIQMTRSYAFFAVL